jgi:hypothetical protein
VVKRESEKKARGKGEEPQAKEKGNGAGCEPYTFVVYVSGPVFKYDVSGRDFEEIYRAGMQLLNRDLAKYQGKVNIERIEIAKLSGLWF